MSPIWQGALTFGLSLVAVTLAVSVAAVVIANFITGG
jgi:hypothetical protein